MTRDTFTVIIESDGSVRVANEDHSTGYLTGLTADELRSIPGRRESIEAAVGYVAARMLKGKDDA